MENLDANKEEQRKDQRKEQTEKSEDNIFSITEIQIEELAIDGICGVY